MPRATPYLVPTDVLADQGKKAAALFAADRPEHHERLARAGLAAERFRVIGECAQSLLDLLVLQQERIASARYAGAVAENALQAVIRWRKDDVLARARVAFDGTSRLVHFRTNELRTHRVAAVTREARLLVRALGRFTQLPEARETGLDEAILQRGDHLLQKLIEADDEEAEARALQVETSADLVERELELSVLLADVEKRAAIAFPIGHAARRRYRMNDIRDYVARHRGASAANVPDPAPGGETAEADEGRVTSGE